MKMLSWSGRPLRVSRRALSLVTLMLSPLAAHAQQLTRGTRAPEIDLPTLVGAPVKLSALRGRPVVVAFWGTWCPSCREEFPALVAAHKKYRENGLEIVAVNQRDQELSTAVVQDFAKEFSVEFTVALDQRGRSRRSFRLIALPTTVFVDTAGVIQHVHTGPINRADMARGLSMILSAR